jgi:hypothetical protein
MSRRTIAGVVLCISVLVVAIATPFIVAKAETFEAWATGWAAVATAAAIVIGGGWALWRYVLPRPFEPTWDVGVHSCSVREQEPGRYRYNVELSLTNT